MKRELEQPRHPRRRLGVPDVRLDAAHRQGLSTSREHRCDERARLDRVAERRARAVRLGKRERVDTSAGIVECGDQQALLRQSAGCGQARAPPILSHRTAKHF